MVFGAFAKMSEAEIESEILVGKFDVCPNKRNTPSPVEARNVQKFQD
jgi:hypothetical protein